jgi:hypothetical protein
MHSVNNSEINRGIGPESLECTRVPPLLCVALASELDLHCSKLIGPGSLDRMEC